MLLGVTVEAVLLLLVKLSGAAPPTDEERDRELKDSWGRSAAFAVATAVGSTLSNMLVFTLVVRRAVPCRSSNQSSSSSSSSSPAAEVQWGGTDRQQQLALDVESCVVAGEWCFLYGASVVVCAKTMGYRGAFLGYVVSYAQVFGGRRHNNNNE